MSNIWATRMANQPVMVGKTDAEWLNQHIAGAALATHDLEAKMTATPPELMADGYWPAEGSWMSRYRPYDVDQGTLYIPVKGMLVHDFGFQIGSWITGYVYIAKAFERGMDDPDVKRIAMVIASGGGEVAGNFDLVDRIYAMRGTKPIRAMVNEASYSAAYSLASAADKITMTRTAGVGSIGVVTAHADYSKMMDKEGIKVTFIHAGEHKVDGNPYTPLTEDVKNRMQTRIDSLYDIFVSTVARNLGVDEQVIRDTEALTYGANDAINLGLAHDVRPFDEAVAAFSGELDETAGEEQMSEITQAQVDAARAEGHATGHAEGLSAGQKEGATTERARVKGILESAEAKNRGEVAFHLALNTAQSVEEATGLLAVTPENKAGAADGANAFNDAMSGNNPNITAEEQAAADQESANASSSLVADYQNATGYKSTGK